MPQMKYFDEASQTWKPLAPTQTEFDAFKTETIRLSAETKKQFMTPQFVEYFGSFNRFGIGVPSGIANYTAGNYVLTVSGNVGESFLTVVSGNIAHAGTTSRWACVIENNDGLFDMNQVTGTDGISKINLLEPLKRNISSKRLGNLHDAAEGQHYTELGYFAFAQHLYYTNPRLTERSQFIAQFKPTDTSGKWVTTAVWTGYNGAKNMVLNNYFIKMGLNHYTISAATETQYSEWEQNLAGEKGYFESYIGLSNGTALVEFFKDGILSGQIEIKNTVKRVTFEYEGVTTAKVRITAKGPFTVSGRQEIYIGLTTWWKNEKFQDAKLLKPNDNTVFIGDSWGVYHNKATTRELKRLLIADGGNPTILDYSKGGHTSTYARVWFDEYVIANKPDKVIIEYFTNDFNSIGGTNVGTFANPSGQQQDMNISNLAEFNKNIQWMIDRAIEKGIQPIVILPASTNSESQISKSSANTVQLRTGKNITVENPSFKNMKTEKAITNEVTSSDSTKVGEGALRIVSKEINSSARKGIMSDTETSIAIADIHGFYNAGVRKAGVNYEGVMDMSGVKLIPRQFDLPLGAAGRGIVYLYNGAASSGDELRVVIQNADGTFARKKIQLLD